MQPTEQLQHYLSCSASSDTKLVFLHLGTPITQQPMMEVTFLFPSTQVYHIFLPKASPCHITAPWWKPAIANVISQCLFHIWAENVLFLPMKIVYFLVISILSTHEHHRYS